jgi:beta-glucosidase/6-phospho-beta-glucosidase/beta-galactosidase
MNVEQSKSRLFRSFFLGGFECSSHRRSDGRRLDVIASTEHDLRSASDYRLLQQHGIRTARDGLRWHLIEHQPGMYDWSSFEPMLCAARDTGTQVIWDLMHYGWPDGIDVWSSTFVDRFGKFAGAAARLFRETSDECPFWTPVNEISFFAWGGGDVGYLNPFAQGRGAELKDQLVRAAIAAIEAVRDVDPRARIVSAEPLIHVHPRSTSRVDVEVARSYTQLAQYEATDFLAGLRRPELGGKLSYLDIVGVNYYRRNQWTDRGPPLDRGDDGYVPLRDLLADVHQRYNRPMFIAETGIEGAERVRWFRYIASEVQAAIAAGTPVAGICLYPVLNHLGWDDDRYCPNGLFCGVEPHGRRSVYQPLADELRNWQRTVAGGQTSSSSAMRTRQS